MHCAQIRTVGGRIKTLAVLTQTLDHKSYDATRSKPFVIFQYLFSNDKYANTHELGHTCELRVEKLKMNVGSTGFVGRHRV